MGVMIGMVKYDVMCDTQEYFDPWHVLETNREKTCWVSNTHTPQSERLKLIGKHIQSMFHEDMASPKRIGKQNTTKTVGHDGNWFFLSFEISRNSALKVEVASDPLGSLTSILSFHFHCCSNFPHSVYIWARQAIQQVKTSASAEPVTLKGFLQTRKISFHSINHDL